MFEICANPLPLVRYLDNPSNREVFESSHSMMLALFASLSNRTGETVELAQLLKSVGPFYLKSLIEVGCPF